MRDSFVAIRAAILAMALGLPWMAGCGTAGRPPAFALTREPWDFHGARGARLLSTHFDVRTTVEDAKVVDVLPQFLETCYRRCTELIPPRRPAGDPLATYVFNTRGQWMRFTDDFVPDRAPLYRNIQSGGYTDQPTATSVLYWIGRDRTLAVASHESWHQYVARHLPLAIPPWLNEGLATQFEAFELRDGVPVFEPRKNYFRRNYLREALIAKENGLYGLPELLRMHAGDVFDSRRRPPDTYYAQVWSLTLFLLEGPNRAYREGFRTLLAEAGTESMRVAVSGYTAATPAAAGLSFGEIVFRRYIAENLDRFSAEYVEYAKELVRGTPRPGTFPW